MIIKETRCLWHTYISDRHLRKTVPKPTLLKHCATPPAQSRKHFQLKHSLLLAIFTLVLQSVNAQTINENLLNCNTPTVWVSGTGPAVSIVGGNMPDHVPITNNQPWTGSYGLSVGGVANSARVVDADLANFASLSYVLVVTGGGRITVESTTGQVPAGYFAGFDIKNTGILNVGLLGSFTIKTYLGDVLQESVAASGGLLSAALLNASGKSRLGFITTKAFNRLMIDQNQTVNLGVVAATEIYNPVIEKFCAETLPRVCNVNEYWKNPVFPVAISPLRTGVSTAVACVGCEVRNVGNVIDNDSTNYAEILIPAGLGSQGSIAVKNTKTVYTAGSFAGFEINDLRTLGVAIGVRHTIRTYLNNVLQDSVTAGDGLVTSGLFTSTGKVITGFKTTKSFDEVRFTASNALAVGTANPIRVYGAVVTNFCAAAALQCNTDTRLKQNSFPLFVDVKNTSINGLACVQCDIIDANNAIDTTSNNYTQVVLPVGVATTATYAITEGSTVYNTNPAEPVFAGFEIENAGLVGLNALNGLSVATTLNGVVQQTVNSSNGLVSLRTSLLNGNAYQTVGFVPTGAFDGVKIIFNSAVNLNIGTTRIYGAVFKKFCTNDLTCNTLTALESPTHPIYINGQRTGVDAITCVGCSINNVQNIVTGTAPATLTMAASVGATAAVAVTNAIETYPAESFAGFEVESASLLSANVLANVHITLYNNNVEVQSGTGDALLLGAQTSIVNGGPNRQVIGVIGHVPFDEVQLNIRNVAGANLGAISIYKAHVQKPCAQPAACNFNRVVNGATESAVINAARTGVRGGVCAGCQVRGAWDAVSASTTDYAQLSNTAGALVQNSLAVALPAYTYPAGTFAGFSVRKNNFIIAANLFPYLTISTYNNGVLQESRSGNSLIDLRVLIQLLGNNNALFIPGFYTSKPFDEVQITIGSLVSALDQYIDVYGAYLDTRGDAASLGLNCNITNPDMTVTPINVPVTGSLASNDKIQSGPATYGSSITVRPGHTNPSAAVPVIQADGSYSFVADVAGSYEFEIAVCYGGDNNNCIKQLFVINVVPDVPKSVKNPPVANTDVAATAHNTVTVVHPLANDEPGSPETQLVPSTVSLADLNAGIPGNTSRGGTATVNPATGDITYTPPADFVGSDTIQYAVCDNQAVPKCSNAFIIVKVLTPDVVNSVTAADDYYMLNSGTGALTVNAANGVLANDSDPEGNSISVIPKDSTIAGKGRFQLAADGSFIFTPEAGFRGTVTLPYAIRDNGSPVASASGSVHIMVKGFIPDLTPTVAVTPGEIHSTTSISLMVEIKEINVVPTNGTITVYLVKNKLMPLQFSAATVQLNGVPVQNAQWTVDGTSNPGYYILRTTQSIVAGTKHTIGFTGTFTPGAATGKINCTTTITRSSGEEENATNNTYAVPILYFEN